jgi:hypothetical protein
MMANTRVNRIVRLRLFWSVKNDRLGFFAVVCCGSDFVSLLFDIIQ